MLFTNVMKSNKDFSLCYRKGKFISNSFVTIYFYPNKSPFNKFGITTSKKIGNAVIRNRAKRIIRVAYRNFEESFPIGYSIVFVARPNIVDAKSTDIENFIKSRVLSEINKEFKEPKKKNVKRKK